MTSTMHNPEHRLHRPITAGVVAGLIAGVVMSTAMLLLASFGIATPLTIFGDRLSVFIPADMFLSLMGRVGGYNHMKQLGVSSVLLGQIGVGAIGGAVFGRLAAKRAKAFSFITTGGIFIALPLFAAAVVLWPVLGTHYRGLPIAPARVITLSGLLAAFVCFERTFIAGFRYLTRRTAPPSDNEFTPSIARRALVLGGLGLIFAGGSAALLRKLYRAATFSYDGTQYKGRGVQAITPNDLFYCVTKNVIDPVVDPGSWRLEVTGLVRTRQTYRLARLKALPAVTQETTLMCISNGLDAGLMSNARWKGVPLAALLNAAGPLEGAAKVLLHGVDNYTDSFPLEKAMELTTLIVYEMNGEVLPRRHGFPARAIVPGYFGEKHVKWITRIAVANADAKGFYEAQGWGPDFIVPTRSRIDQPEHEERIEAAAAANGIPIKGVAFGGDRGISRVEVSVDDGETWEQAKIDYPGTKLTWVLWSYAWKPDEPGDYTVAVRATDGEGELQELDEERPFKSGTTGFHKIVVHVTS